MIQIPRAADAAVDHLVRSVVAVAGGRTSRSRLWSPPTYGAGDASRPPPRAAWPCVSGPGAPFLPKRALVLAQELLTRGVEAIKADS